MGWWLTYATAHVAFGLYAAALAARCWPLGPPLAAARAAWLAGSAALWLHVVSAFHFVHDWSHARAYADTARQTRELTGLDWGGGLYLNYALLLVWTADAAWWRWAGHLRYERRSTALAAGIQLFLAFMWLNATVVFGSGSIRWLAAVVLTVLAVCWWINRRRGFGERHGN